MTRMLNFRTGHQSNHFPSHPFKLCHSPETIRSLRQLIDDFVVDLVLENPDIVPDFELKIAQIVLRPF